MSIQTESNNGLYFIVGALVVVVAILGFFYIANDGDMPKIEPASGVEKAAEKTTSEFKVNIDDNSISATTSQSD